MGARTAKVHREPMAQKEKPALERTTTPKRRSQPPFQHRAITTCMIYLRKRKDPCTEEIVGVNRGHKQVPHETLSSPRERRFLQEVSVREKGVQCKIPISPAPCGGGAGRNDQHNKPGGPKNPAPRMPNASTRPAAIFKRRVAEGLGENRVYAKHQEPATS